MANLILILLIIHHQFLTQRQVKRLHTLFWVQKNVYKMVNSAKNAYISWSSETPLMISRKMFKLKEHEFGELAELITLNGKTFDDALGELV